MLAASQARANKSTQWVSGGAPVSGVACCRIPFPHFPASHAALALQEAKMPLSVSRAVTQRPYSNHRPTAGRNEEWTCNKVHRRVEAW